MTAQAVDLGGGIIAIQAAADRRNQALPLVETDGLGVNPQEVGDNLQGIITLSGLRH